MMAAPLADMARAACEALADAFGQHADAGEAQALAALFTRDGVFIRLGVPIAGRDAIQRFIAHRPRDLRQTHRNSNFQWVLSEDGQSASGTLDLALDRARPGDAQPQETLHCRYHDRFVLTPEGWRFALREVVMVAPD